MTKLDDARRYFQSATNCFFRWDEAGEWLSWDNGNLSVTHHQELAAVLRRLSGTALPPLLGVQVLLAVCRDNWPVARHFLDIFSEDPEHIDGGNQINDRLRTNWQLADAVRADLDRIHNFPSELLSNLDARCELVAMVLERCPKQNAPSDNSSFIADVLESGHITDLLATEGAPTRLGGGYQHLLETWQRQSVQSLKRSSANQHSDDKNAPVPLPEPPDQLIQDAKTLMHALLFMREGLAALDADELHQRIKTGLPRELNPADDIAPNERARALIQTLLNDEELGGIARLARDLLAVVHFPRAISEPDNLPLGGVSDITNRGNLDQLLLSELGYDDLTLAVRISMNEALYLRRESPPKSRSRRRRVLIDCGLCLWGVPRVYATAVALAMTATADSDTEVVCYCATDEFQHADGKSVMPVDLLTREGVEQQLSQIHAQLDNRDCFPAFMTTANDDDDDCEFVFITSNDVLRDPTYRQAIDNSISQPACVIAVDRDGGLELTVRSATGQRTLKQARLDIHQLTQSEPTEILISDDRSLPAFIQLNHVPLLLSHPVNPKRLFSVAGGVVAFANDGRAMLWTSKSHGAQQIAQNVPKGGIQCVVQHEPDSVTAAVGQLTSHGLSLVHVQNATASVTNIYLQTNEPVRGICLHAGWLYAILQKSVQIYESESGSYVSQLHIPSGLKWSGRRFFRRGTTWYAVSFDGLNIQFEHIPQVDGKELQLFDRMGLGIAALNLENQTLYQTWDEIGLAITRDGTLIAKAMNSSEFSLVWVSPDGKQFVVRTQTSGALINTDNGQVVNESRYIDSIIPKSQQFFEVTPRHRFRGIYVSDDGKLRLISVKNDHLEWDFDQSQSRFLFRIVQSPNDLDSSRVIPFREMDSKHGYTLSVATWRDGSHAWIDSRGLLHLQSANDSIPEMTLVTCPRSIGGWLMGYGVFGMSYYIPENTEPIPNERAWELGMQPFIKELPWHLHYESDTTVA